MKNKESEYLALVDKRKKCELCHYLTNPSKFPDLDSLEIGPWSIWQGNLNAEILVVGQDWGGVEYFNKWDGNDAGIYEANKNLVELFNSVLGLPITNPKDKKNLDLAFFTNIILCLREGNLTTKSENITDSYLKNCSEVCGKKFLRPLIGIIQPRIIIALGMIPYQAIVRTFGLTPEITLTAAVDSNKLVIVGNNSRLFPVFHCGKKGILNRDFESQKRDWEKIRDYLNEG